jgi:tetratricopeptide (TPR) repeat protein
VNSYQDVLARLQAAQSDDERAWITLQFNLDKQSKDVRDAVQAAAVLHWFDHKVLNYVLETPLTDAAFSTLVSLPYIEAFSERGWNVHEKTRDMLCDKLWQEDASRYRKLSRRAATWRRKYNPADLVWRAEATYHSLLAGERNAEQAFINLSIDWLNHDQYDVLEFLIRPVLKAAQAGRLSGRGAAWALFFGARIDYIFGRKQEAKEALTQALTIKTDDAPLIVNCTETLGDVYRTLEELPLARKYYESAQSKLRALKFHLGEANCIHSLGLVHMALSEIPQAIACNESAMRIYRTLNNHLGIINCIHAQGSINAFTAKFSQAKGDFEKALKMYSGIKNQLGEANCIKSLAMLASEEDEPDAALAYFDDAIQRFEDLGITSEKARCYNDIGNLYNYSQRFHESIASYTRAIEITAEVHFFTNRAEPYMHLGDFKAAQNDLDAAAAINPNYYYMQFNRGRLDLWLGQAQSALGHFDLALEQRPHYGEFHLWRAMALVLNGAVWEEELQTGLACTYLIRQIKEVADALDKLSPTYGIQFEGLRTVLQTELAARISASRI